MIVRRYFAGRLLLAGLACLLSVTAVAQEDTGAGQAAVVEKKPANSYEFKTDVDLQRTEIKSQDNTGTCWSFATTSFIESELLRQGKGAHDLSEMFVVRNTYEAKAKNFLLRQGKANFSEGALAHDLLNAAERFGLVPEEIYSGRLPGDARHDHSELQMLLNSMLVPMAEKKKAGAKWWSAYRGVIDSYMGAAPEEFSYQGQTFTPKSFAEHVNFNADDYVNFTSYTHHPFGQPFVLEIPDNFSNGSFHNIPIDDLVATIDRALDNGYSVAWDGDVSERGFARDKGIAVLPANNQSRDFTRAPVEELKVTQDMRQAALEDFTTTDDHLMHLVGRAFDGNGTKYYLIKNSWGPVGEHAGYLYMSEAYLRLKTVAITVHKDVKKPGDAE